MKGGDSMANEPEKEKEKGNNEKAMTKARLLKKHTVSDLSKTVCFFMKVFTELFSKSDRILFTCSPLRSQPQQQRSYGMTGTVAYYCKAEIDYLDASSIATATATVIPTMGLLPAPMRPIIST